MRQMPFEKGTSELLMVLIAPVDASSPIHPGPQFSPSFWFSWRSCFQLAVPVTPISAVKGDLQGLQLSVPSLWDLSQAPCYQQKQKGPVYMLMRLIYETVEMAAAKSTGDSSRVSELRSEHPWLVAHSHLWLQLQGSWCLFWPRQALIHMVGTQSQTHAYT